MPPLPPIDLTLAQRVAEFLFAVGSMLFVMYRNTRRPPSSDKNLTPPSSPAAAASVGADASGAEYNRLFRAMAGDLTEADERLHASEHELRGARTEMDAFRATTRALLGRLLQECPALTLTEGDMAYLRQLGIEIVARQERAQAAIHDARQHVQDTRQHVQDSRTLAHATDSARDDVADGQDMDTPSPMDVPESDVP